MKALLTAGALVVAATLTTSAATPAPVQAQGPTNRCYGEIVAGIASTWPWAHDGKVAFPPSPGAIALWIQEFGPSVGVTSVRQLQLRFCTEQ